MSAPELPEGAKPRVAPIPDAESAPVWAGTGEGKLLVQECSSCGQRQLYGRSLCTNCHSAALTWIESSGKGTIYSRTIIRQNPSRSFKHLIPFVVALVDLDGFLHPRLGPAGHEAQGHRLARARTPAERAQVVGALAPHDIAASGGLPAPELDRPGRDRVDHDAHGCVDAFRPEGRDGLVGDAARDDVVEHRQVGIDVEGEAVHRATAGQPHPDRRDLAR